MATLFFGHMRYDAKNPRYHNNDRFILSKGHAAPLLYAAWAEAGLFPADELLKLRRIDSDLEGHPTPRLPFVDVATGSLGQGLSVGVGMALAARFDQLDYSIYVLLGDGEIAEGAVWEAASLAGTYKLNNLIAIVDLNRLGQTPGHGVRSRPGSLPEAIRGIRLACRGRGRPRHRGNSGSSQWRGFERSAARDSGQDLQRGRSFLSAGQGRLARQTVEPGRSRQGHR